MSTKPIRVKDGSLRVFTDAEWEQVQRPKNQYDWDLRLWIIKSQRPKLLLDPHRRMHPMSETFEGMERRLREAIATLRRRAELAEAERDRAQRASDMYMAERDRAWTDMHKVEVVLAASQAREAAMREALNYVADNTYCGSDAEWRFKLGYEPQVVLDALASATPEGQGGADQTHFVLDPEQYDAFVTALDDPPAPAEKLKALMQSDPASATPQENTDD